MKYLEEQEKKKRTEAELDGKEYKELLALEFRWETWAVPKDKEGKLDHHKALSGDDLKDFVDQKNNAPPQPKGFLPRQKIACWRVWFDWRLFPQNRKILGPRKQEVFSRLGCSGIKTVKFTTGILKDNVIKLRKY